MFLHIFLPTDPKIFHLLMSKLMSSCQKVLGGWANIANEYATKRYRSNLINWGMFPFITEEDHESLSFGTYHIRFHICLFLFYRFPDVRHKNVIAVPKGK